MQRTERIVFALLILGIAAALTALALMLTPDAPMAHVYDGAHLVSLSKGGGIL